MSNFCSGAPNRQKRPPPSTCGRTFVDVLLPFGSLIPFPSSIKTSAMDPHAEGGPPKAEVAEVDVEIGLKVGLGAKSQADGVTGASCRAAARVVAVARVVHLPQRP